MHRHFVFARLLPRSALQRPLFLHALRLTYRSFPSADPVSYPPQRRPPCCRPSRIDADRLLDGHAVATDRHLQQMQSPRTHLLRVGGLRLCLQRHSGFSRNPRGRADRGCHKTRSTQETTISGEPNPRRLSTRWSRPPLPPGGFDPPPPPPPFFFLGVSPLLG